MRKTIFFVSIVCLAAATALLIWTAKSNSPLLAQTTPPVSTGRLLVVDLPSAPVQLRTDVGVQTSTLRGQITFVQTIASNGQPSLQLQSFNFVGSPVSTKRGLTGVLGISLKRGTEVTEQFIPTSGKLKINFEAVIHYPLIDKIVGQKQISLDHVVAFTEVFRGQYTATFSQPVLPQSTSNVIDGRALLQLTQGVLGSVQSFDPDFAPTPVRPLLAGPCAFGVQTLPIKPVFLSSGIRGVTPRTGKSLCKLLSRAREIWGKGCIQFSLRVPAVLEKPNYRVLGDDETVDNFLNDPDIAAVFVADAVEIFFIDSWDPLPAHGGSTTATLVDAANTESARIIVADNIVDQVPPNLNALAHELGHALALCHPGLRTCGSVPNGSSGSPNTVMEASGFGEDNPCFQSLRNVQDATSPLLLVSSLIPCCLRTDCSNNAECRRLDAANCPAFDEANCPD